MPRLPTFMLCVLFSVPTLADDHAVKPPAETPADPRARINQFVAASWEANQLRPAKKCSDRAFVRRVHLDLAGRVPTIQEVNAFLSDESEEKRTRLVDHLLAGEDYVQHFADTFDTLLMGRAAEHQYGERVKHQWRAFLEDVFRSNRRWNDVVADILLARPDSQDQRGAVWFLFERNNKHQEIAEAVAPAFFGIRVECAQCHDHMVADEILQEHYWGLVAFFNRGKNEHTKNGPRVAESTIGGFSEFADLSGDSSPNLLTFFESKTIDEARPKKDEKEADKDELYEPASMKGDPRVPKFSRRERFVEEIVHGHTLVPRALVNRVWAMLMGRGIIHPFDEMDSVHPPSLPKLLDWLAEDFVSSGFDIRRLVRAIALSDAYHLESIKPSGVEDPATFAWYLERPLTAEQFARSVQLVVRGSFKNNDPLVGLFRQQFLDVLPDETTVTIADALFLSNNAGLQKYIGQSNSEEHLVGRLLKSNTVAERVDQLFQTAYGRQPDPSETEAVTKYLNGHNESPEKTLHHVIWSLVTSAEFRFNH